MGKEGLKKTFIGSNGLEVTNICFGTAPLGGMPYEGRENVSEKEAIFTLLGIFKSPVNFLDTASAYAASEYRIGRAIAEFGGLPPGFIIATKADRNLETGDFSAEQVRRSAEQSRKLLGLNHLPIVYLHDPEHSSFTFEQIMGSQGSIEQLIRFKDGGVIGCLGISGGPIGMMRRFVETGIFDIAITHNRYTLVNRAAEPLLKDIENKKVALVNAAVYGGGILTERSTQLSRYAYKNAPRDVIERIKKLGSVCLKFGIPLAAVALQFSLRDSRITSSVVGVCSMEEVEQTLVLVQMKIPNDLWTELENFPYDTQDPG